MVRPASTRFLNGLLIVLILLVVGLMLLLFTCRRGATTKELTFTPPVAGLEIPAPRNGDTPILHEGYALGYRTDAGQAAWAAYQLTGSEVRAANTPRSNDFRPDPAVPGGTADNSDYEQSGYDRGHLAPAEDLSFSTKAMSGSFYYSNISPQLPAFNRGVWRRLEELVRFWARTYDTVYVVTGPVLEPNLRTVGPHYVAVPNQFYKVVLRYGGGGASAMGFLLNNAPSAATLRSFAVPVDSVERVTGLDFFPQLPDDVEREVERRADEASWKWTRERKK
ncbi:MAG: DNA/RNA non-specific endonuclease [Chitinophagaceae bacterium]|nr:MAG: DNA/RNA non-specific endonuclease [Chitinophagaceae bacterium]